MEQVAEHYAAFGGVSPINAQNRLLVEALTKELNAKGPVLPIYWGNRNWRPMLADTLKQMSTDKVKNALAFVTAAYSSYSSCRQYLENIEEARKAAGSDAPKVDKIRAFFNHPLFIEANTERVREALTQMDAEKVEIAFTAHSIPASMADACSYQKQLLEASRLVAEALGHKNWKLVFQSRSGPPTQPWLEPDICDYVRELHKNGVRNLVIHPIGFVCDHLEVIYDLDTQARQLCDELGMVMIRSATVGTHSKYIAMIRELILERVEGAPRRSVGDMPMCADACASDCCPAPQYVSTKR